MEKTNTETKTEKVDYKVVNYEMSKNDFNDWGKLIFRSFDGKFGEAIQVNLPNAGGSFVLSGQWKHKNTQDGIIAFGIPTAEADGQARIFKIKHYNKETKESTFSNMTGIEVINLLDATQLKRQPKKEAFDYM